MLKKCDIYAITNGVLALPKLERANTIGLCPYDRAQGVSAFRAFLRAKGCHTYK